MPHTEHTPALVAFVAALHQMSPGDIALAAPSLPAASASPQPVHTGALLDASSCSVAVEIAAVGMAAAVVGMTAAVVGMAAAVEIAAGWPCTPLY